MSKFGKVESNFCFRLYLLMTHILIYCYRIFDLWFLRFLYIYNIFSWINHFVFCLHIPRIWVCVIRIGDQIMTFITWTRGIKCIPTGTIFIPIWCWRGDIKPVSVLTLCGGNQSVIPSQGAINVQLCCFIWCQPEQAFKQTIKLLVIWDAYRKISNIRRTKSANLNVSRLVVQLSLPKSMKPCVKSRMKM